MIKIIFVMYDYDFKIFLKNILCLIKKKIFIKVYCILYNNNDILVKCMKYKIVCIFFKNF